MPLEDLLAALERETESRARGVLEEAHREAARLAASALERIGSRRADLEQRTGAELRADSRRAVAEASRDARRRVLEARQRLLDRVFQAARERLDEAIRSPAYLGSLRREVEEALSYLGGAPALVRCPPFLEPEIRKLPAGEVTVVADPAAGAGFLVEAADGSLRVDATLEDRLARMRPVLSLEVMKEVEAPREVPECAGKT